MILIKANAHLCGMMHLCAQAWPAQKPAEAVGPSMHLLLTQT
jgi:hypothetical protein